MINVQTGRRHVIFLFAILLISWSVFSSCSLQKKISVSAKENLLNTPDLGSAHIGISIYEPAANRYWYNYQADKFFTPASNTKIFSCYAGMKWLGDSLNGLSYTENASGLFIQGTGDPTLLHPDYKNQPVVSFLQHTDKSIYINNSNWQENAWGTGWSWDDYNDDYMAERSALPVYGNMIQFIQTQTEGNADQYNKPQSTIYTEPEIGWKLNFSPDTAARFSVKRNLNENIFTIHASKEKTKSVYVPFVTNGVAAALELLKDSIGKEIRFAPANQPGRTGIHFIKTQSSDSVFKPMMHRSDNFFAEQTLLMVSNQLLGFMNDDKIIDTLLKTDFKDLPQKPNWVDGCGLSRFNLFTPQDFVWVLNKMQQEFSWQRISTIFSAGNEGTLTNYYTSMGSFIHAKTGSLTGVIALSGYLRTKKNKALIFSVLVNNHQTSGRNVRKAIEKFIQSIRDTY
jgi:D-alanyl-D-alanine carboxypeptidase/D-alanyl-D-alanine-endopeptidase (penicillin-binding protein 4)